MKKIIFILVSFFLYNVQAGQCGSFGEMRSSIEEILNQRGGDVANYVGSSGSAQVNFDNGQIIVANGVCSPVGNVCVSGPSVRMRVQCQGGSHRNIDLNITRLENNQFRIQGRVGPFSQTQLLHATSYGDSSDEFFTLDVAPAQSDLDWAQMMIDLDRAERNQRVDQIKTRSNSRQPASVVIPSSNTEAIDL